MSILLINTGAEEARYLSRNIISYGKTGTEKLWINVTGGEDILYKIDGNADNVLRYIDKMITIPDIRIDINLKDGTYSCINLSDL
jgi:hypothetical protein